VNLEWFSILRLRLRALIERRRLDRDLEAEMAFHLAARAEKTGMAEARRRFGNPTAVKETCRDMWTFYWMEMLWQDLRYAARTLRKSPAFTAVAVLTLAVGIGANTAIFSVVNAVILRPLPYPEPDRLVGLFGNVKRAKVERRGTSFADYLDWRSQAKSFEDMALFIGSNMTLTGLDEPERIQGEFIGQAYFQLLGIRPALGRTFRPDEDQVPQRNAVVVLSDGLWKRRFGGDPGIVGRTLQLDGSGYTVIGVAPPGFRGVEDNADLWIPLMMALRPQDLANRGTRGPTVLARLKPGVAMAQAQSEMDAICKDLERTYRKTNEGRGVELSPIAQEIFGDIRRPLVLLLAAVGMVLLIACTNVANLLLARSEARQREIAMRIALGAGRGRMLHQLSTESLALVLTGGLAGLLMARFGVRALMAASPITFPGYVHPGIDWTVALFTLVISCIAGLALGLAPAAHVRSGNLFEAFKQASSHSADSRGGRGFRNVLVVAEVAFAMLLLVGAGLLMRSLQELAALHPGYDPSHVLALRVTLPRSNAPTAIMARDIVERVAKIPSVESVATGSDAPLGGGNAIFYTAEGQPPVTAQNRPRAYLHRVSPSFFQTLRIPFVAGRPFQEQEMQDHSNAVIVSENVARRFWPGQDPIGKRIKDGDPTSDSPWWTIVGVVNEMKYRGLPENPTNDPDLFLPFSERQRGFALLVRTPLAPASVAPSVRKVLHDADSTTVVYNVSTLEQLIERETARSRFTGWLMAIFAASALLLAMIGIYGVMSYAVSRRTQEIGIRVALGAARSDVLKMVVGRGMGLIAIGLALGIAGAAALTRVMSSLLYGVTATDLVSFAAAALVLATVALLACLIPAARAARIHPAIALRNE
jgi:predicted permease